MSATWRLSLVVVVGALAVAIGCRKETKPSTVPPRNDSLEAVLAKIGPARAPSEALQMRFYEEVMASRLLLPRSGSLGGSDKPTMLEPGAKLKLLFVEGPGGRLYAPAFTRTDLMRSWNDSANLHAIWFQSIHALAEIVVNDPNIAGIVINPDMGSSSGQPVDRGFFETILAR